MPIETPPKDVGELANYWRLTARTLSRMRAADPPAPLHDCEATVHWFAGLTFERQNRMTPAFRAKVREIRDKYGIVPATKAAAAAGVSQDEFAKFKADRKAHGAKDTDALAELKSLRDFALHKIAKATEAGDLVAVNAATKLMVHFSSVIHDEEIRAQRLGREAGDLIPSETFEAIVRAIPFWLVRGVDDLQSEIIPKIVAASGHGELGHEQLRKLIEPALLSARVLVPFVRSSQVVTGVSIPKRILDAMKSGLDDTIEDGAAEFTRLYGEPIAGSEAATNDATP